jgi:hypothetical protein
MTHAELQPGTLPDPAAVTTADIVVGIPTYNDADRIGQALRAAQAACEGLGAGASCAILQVDGESTDGTREQAAGLAASVVPILQLRYRMDGVNRMAGPYLGVPARGNAVRVVFETAHRLGARACAVLDTDLSRFSRGWLDALLRPVLTQDVDFVAPYYARHRFAGAINNGIAYPLTRTLYGRRVRYPLGGDFACSTRFVERSLRDPGWDTDIARSMVDLWLTTRALTDGSRVGQAMLGVKRQIWRDQGGDAAAPLARVLAALFQGAERWQSVWQKVRGSESVGVSGVTDMVDDVPVAVDVRQGIETFRLAQKTLDEIWRLILPPRTLLELRKLAAARDDAFRLPDEIWARCLFDFSLAYHQRTLNREHVLTAFAPLFAAWVSSFVADVRDVTHARSEERLDRMCLRFESEKPYLISRWRWPDRFSP